MTPLPPTEAQSSSRPTTPRFTPGVSPTLPGSTFAQPFDRFTANGGGASRDIFRRFKIPKSGEEHFIMHWVRHPLSPGFLTRDEHGTLVFRVSSSEISYLSTLKIGRPDSELDNGVEVEWTYVYDQQGIPWLRRSRGVDCLAGEIDMYDILDEQYEGTTRERISTNGMYGPSGLTPAEFYRGSGHSSTSESD